MREVTIRELINACSKVELEHKKIEEILKAKVRKNLSNEKALELIKLSEESDSESLSQEQKDEKLKQLSIKIEEILAEIRKKQDKNKSADDDTSR